jgi:hypothetical protein
MDHEQTDPQRGQGADEEKTTVPVPVTPTLGESEATLLRGQLDPVYAAKARILNDAIKEMGMGRYQWQLFVVVGFGWASDNLWP